MVGALFDTNILIDYLRGLEPARAELANYEQKAISIITWMEVMMGASPALERTTEGFLASFAVVALDDRVAREAVALRKRHRLRLPDAIIWASARVGGMLLVTRDARDFSASDPGVRLPYAI